MRGRQCVGYVVAIDGPEVILNLVDLHRGHFAGHSDGVSTVTEVGSLLAINAGSYALVMRVLSLSFAEPREAHRWGSKANAESEPLRHVNGVVVGRLEGSGKSANFNPDGLSSPALGAEAFPLSEADSAAVLGANKSHAAPIHLGDDLRGGGRLVVGLEDLISRHVAVLGSSGQGKSCFTAAILQQIVRFPGARIIIFDINGEYESAFDKTALPPGSVKVTQLGDFGESGLRLPYFALGRQGLHRLLLPSDRTQRPALNFAIEHLNRLRWFPALGGAGLATDLAPTLFDDCRAVGADVAAARMHSLRTLNAPLVGTWPHMSAISALVAESYALAPKGGGWERNAFSYGNVAPLVSRINRLVEDPMFREVVDVEGGVGAAAPLNWAAESTNLVERVFGGEQVDWRVHILDLRRVTHDLTPFVLGALLELYAFELFKRGQDAKRPTLLVLEEAHHYLRPVGTGDEVAANSLAYERLAKEGRKFGLALWLSTQRPSEVSPTVLSQCNNWISFRLTAEKDIAAIQSASEWADRRDVRRIAGLARQMAMAFGGSLRMPALIRAPLASPLPRSEDARFDSWSNPNV
jgi:hypothetical protein